MDAEISKMAQKMLTKQGMKFKLNTKVVNGDASGNGVILDVEAAKGGKNEKVSALRAFERRCWLTPAGSLTPTLFSLPSAVSPTPGA